jgi:hypothetical protein
MSTALVALTEEQEQLQQESITLTEQAKTLQIIDDNGHQAASGLLERLVTAQKILEGDVQPKPESFFERTLAGVGLSKRSTYASYSTAMELYNLFAKPIKASADALRMTIGGYIATKEREAKEEEERRRRQAEKEAEEKRQLLLREERERRAAELAEREAAAKREADERRASGDTATAQQIEEMAAKEIETLRSKPLFIPRVAPAPVAAVTASRPTYQGQSYRPDYDFRIINEVAIPRQFLTPDLAKIRNHVKLWKDKSLPGQMQAIAGVEAFEKQVVGQRTQR